ncbi:MAG: histidine kinase [Bacteroidota bacterium]
MNPFRYRVIILLAFIHLISVSNSSAQPDIEFYRFPTNKAPGTKIESVFKDSYGYLWLGKPDGLLRHDGINFTSYTHDSRNAQSISSNDAATFFQDSKNQLWIGTKTGGVCRFDYTTEAFEYFPFQKDLYPDSDKQVEGAWVIFEDMNQNIWAGSRFHGLQVLEKGARAFKGYLPNGAGNDPIGTRTVRAAIPKTGEDNQFWIGTLTALFEFDADTRSFEKHDLNAKRFNGEVASVYCITPDSDSTLLTGGWGDGMIRYNFKSKKIEQFLYRDLLSSANIVYDILKLSDHEVLLGTVDRALIYYNLNTRENYWYAYDDSRPNRSWRGQTYDTYLDSTGRVWMAQAHGFTTFRLYPDTTQSSTKPPCISAIYIDNKKMDLGTDLNKVQSISLIPNQNFVSIEMGDFQLEPNFEHEFQYRAAGYSDTWRKANSNVIELQNLKGGSYDLQVQSKTKDGSWSEIKAITIDVAIPFWKQLWFIASVLAAAAGIIFLGLRFRINQIRKEAQMKTQFERQLNEIELNALRAQMNPHFLFNCLNSINKYIISNKPREASEYLTKFSWLMRLILQNSKNKFISLEDELETLEIYIQLEQLRFENKFSYEIKTPEDLYLSSIKIPPLLLQPYVENAIWHGLMHKMSDGHLLIDIKLEDHVLICIVEDDGIGRRRSAEIKAQNPNRKKSLGTEITQNRIELIKKLYQLEADVNIEDLPNDSGTIVIISLPQEN